MIKKWNLKNKKTETKEFTSYSQLHASAHFYGAVFGLSFYNTFL